jgi:hypothetical protein
VGSGLVDLAIAKRKLVTQGESEFAEPAVIGPGLPNPDAAGMVGMGLLVRSCRETTRVNDPVGTIEELGRFKDHLYDMLVAMMFRSDAGIEGKEEDVHGGHRSSPRRSPICFGQHR